MNFKPAPILKLLLSATGLVTFAAILGACVAAPSVSLNNTHWKLVGIDQRLAPQGMSITLDFTDGKLGGRSGCNSYGGSYRLEGDHLTFPEPLISTLMACPGDVMTWESTYLAALGDNPRVAIQNQGLILTGAKGTVLTFVPQ